MAAWAHNLPTLPPSSSSSGGPSLVVVVIRSRCPHPTRRPLTRMRCRRNVASPPAHASPSSVWWDAIRPPLRCHRCHCCPAISTVAHPRYPPNTQPLDTPVDVFVVAAVVNHGHLFEGHVIRISLVDPFHSTSALLHFFVRPSCRGAVGRGWMVHVQCVSPDLYALRRLQNT